MHLSYEKSGLTIDQPPIPWNAEAVLVEVAVRAQACRKDDFVLRLNGASFAPDALRKESPGEPARVFFRIPVPQEDTVAELHWQGNRLSAIPLAILPREAFVATFTLQMPTVHARLGEHAVACQTFVGAQCQALFASALVGAATNLVPLVDLDLRVELHDTAVLQSVPVQIASSQMRGRQALVAAHLAKPRKTGDYAVVWKLGAQELARSRLRVVSKKQFLRSLRVSATRYVLQMSDGGMRVVRHLPTVGNEIDLAGVARVGPCFLASSSQAGMAGLASFQVLAEVAGAERPPLLLEQECLVTDGPMPLLLGTLDAAELAQVKHFTLRTAEGTLGVLPVLASPTVRFTSEGGVQKIEDFAWSSAAEEQLNERLGQLLEG
jgi:hypothetical protein